MSDIPPILEPAPHRRHWLEYVATGVALLLSAVSLWVAIGTMDANQKMVAASSWPYLQLTTSDAAPDGTDVLTFDIGNAGVGPALVENFEVQYNGKPIASSAQLLQRCCGYDPRQPHPVAVHQPSIGSWTEGTVGGSVIRAGETRNFFKMVRTAQNVHTFNTLREAIAARRLVARYCYCSVFSECWQSPFTGLHPTRVDRCAVPAVPYTE